jgi:hypothetical protein
VGLGYVSLESAWLDDVILKDDLALLGGSKQVTLVSLTDLARPKILGTVQGVGGRLALGDGDILFSTERSQFGGTNLPLGGVRTAALGQTAIIERIKPSRVVVDENKKAAENFEVKYRVIPSSYDVQTAQLELRSGTTTYQTLPVALTNGAGRTTLQTGTDLSRPVPEVRLVVNAGAPDELIGFTKRVPPATVQLQPSELVELSADVPEMELVAYSDSHLERRRAAEAAGETPVNVPLTWEVQGAVATLAFNPSVSSTGVFATRLKTATTPGVTYQLRVRLPGSGVVASSEPISVAPGPAATVTMTASKSALPADSASETTLTLVARDKYGNPVADGTAVSWVIDGRGSIEPEPTTYTTGGTTSATYRAGDTDGEVTITAKVGQGVEGTTTVTLAALVITVSPHAPSIVANSTTGLPVSVSVTTSAGPPSDSAELTMFATLGRLGLTSPLSSGEASALFVPFGVPRRAKLWASVASYRGEGTVEVLQPSPMSGPAVTFDRPGFVGDKTEDGVATFETVDGELKAIPYATSSTVTVSGEPGQVIELVIGDALYPRVEPVALYPMDELEGGLVFDEYHDHHGSAAGAVSVDYVKKATGMGSLRFGGAGLATIADHPALNLTGDLGVIVQFRAEEAHAATLLSKAGAYGLALVPEGAGVRVRAFARLADGGEVEALSDAVSVDTWHQAGAMIEGGSLVLNVDGTEIRVLVSGAVAVMDGPLALGEDFRGNLDDCRVFDLTRPKLMSFDDGTFKKEVTIGPTGTATVEVRSLGNLRTNSPKWNRQTLKYKIKDAVTPYLFSFEQIWALEFMLGFVDGFVTGEIDSPEHFLGDMLASLLIYGDARDGIISGNKIGEGTAEKGDYWLLAFSILGLLTEITIVGELISVPLKAAFKLLRKLDDTKVARLFSRYVIQAIADFLRGSKTKFLALVEFARIAPGNPVVWYHLVKISGGLTNFSRIDHIIRLTAKTGESGRVIKALSAAHDAMAALPAAKRLENVGHILDLVGHQVDTAGKLGLDVAALSDEAILGAAHFLETVDDAGKAKQTMEALLNGVKNGSDGIFGKWHPGVMDEFFSSVRCVPKGTKGFRDFLGKVDGVNKVKGAYAVLRLYCQAPELKLGGNGKEIADIADLLENGKEGVDLVAHLPSNLPAYTGKIPEFWEFKHVLNAGSAVTERQIKKHIETKVATFYRDLLGSGLSPEQVRQVMSQVRLRIEVIAPNASTATKKKLYDEVTAIINDQYKGLVDAGFRFDLSDVFMRAENPLVTPTPVLSAAF